MERPQKLRLAAREKLQDTLIADYVIKAEDGAMEFFFLKMGDVHINRRTNQMPFFPVIFLNVQLTYQIVCLEQTFSKFF